MRKTEISKRWSKTTKTELFW